MGNNGLSALLAAIASAIVGMVVGAGLQRWSDGARSVEHLSASTPSNVTWRWTSAPTVRSYEMSVHDDDGEA